MTDCDERSMRGGSPVAADRTGLPNLRRFVDGVVVAVQRGRPLADVLRAQGEDVREEGRGP